MADNLAVTAGTGTTIAADDIGGGVLAQRVKPVWGPDGTGNDVDVASGKPLPAQIRSATGLIPIGEPTDAKNTATDTTSVTAISIWKQISASVQAIATSVAGTLTVATHAVTQSGSWVLSAGAALIGKVGIDQTTDGTTNKVAADLRVAGSAIATGSGANGSTVIRTALATDSPGVVPTAAPGTLSATGPTVTAVGPSNYETVAASATAQVLGATGGTGDYIQGLLVIPATTSPGNVLLLDNATSITVFTGGATSVSNLVPFLIPLGMTSVSGAWKVTTGTNVSAIGVGKFT